LQRAAKSDAMQQSKYWWEIKIEEISSNIRVLPETKKQEADTIFILRGQAKSKNG
jgi:hypothetical protein